MNRRSIPILAESLEMYYDKDEFIELAGLFDVELNANVYHDWKWLPLARQLIMDIDHGNNREFLVQVLEQVEIRNLNAIARTDWERRTPHQHLERTIRELKREVARPPMGSLALRPGDLLTIPEDGFVSRHHPFRFLHGCDPSYEALTFTPVGLTSH